MGGFRSHACGQIFVGGSGRSGTTVTGYLVGKHPEAWATMPREIRILTDDGGLLDLALGPRSWGRRVVHLGAMRVHLSRTQPSVRIGGDAQEIAQFIAHMRDGWWHRIGPDGTARGFHRGADRDEYEAALSRFAAAAGTNPRRAARDLISELLDPPAGRAGARLWCETTPDNAAHADRITRLLPEAKVIHMVRDGRDACASVLTKNWGPTDPIAALTWWRRRVLASHMAMSRAPQDRVMTLVLEDLIVHKREESYQRILAFVGLDDHPTMREYFATKMPAERGNPGRWKRDIPADEVDDFQRTYAEFHEELTAQGIPLPPL